MESSCKIMLKKILQIFANQQANDGEEPMESSCKIMPKKIADLRESTGDKRTENVTKTAENAQHRSQIFRNLCGSVPHPLSSPPPPTQKKEIKKKKKEEDR